MRSETLILSIVVSIGFGVYALWLGWTRVFNPARAALTPPELIAIALIHLIQGEVKASQRKNELMEPAKLKRSGYSYVATGGLLLLAAALQFAGLIVGSVSR